jgi:hypothetical protein
VLKPHFQPAGVEPGTEEEGPLSTDAKADPVAAAAKAGRDFAEDWARAADLSDVGELLAGAPRIPKDLDVQLLPAAEEALGLSLRGAEDLRRALRDGFWEGIRARLETGRTKGGDCEEITRDRESARAASTGRSARTTGSTPTRRLLSLFPPPETALGPLMCGSPSPDISSLCLPLVSVTPFKLGGERLLRVVSPTGS